MFDKFCGVVVAGTEDTVIARLISFVVACCAYTTELQIRTSLNVRSADSVMSKHLNAHGPEVSKRGTVTFALQDARVSAKIS